MKQVVLTATYIHSEIYSMVTEAIQKTGYEEMQDEIIDRVYGLVDPATDSNISNFRDIKNQKGAENLYDSSMIDYIIKKLKDETNKPINSVVKDYTIINAINKVQEWKIRVLLLYCVEYMESLRIKIEQEKY